MEEAPQGTFEDELEWCIRQLESGLLRRNPTPKQASDAQWVLQVLRSRKAPFVKKRAVMNRVFGNYRLKMAEERKAQHMAAADPPDAHIEEGAARDSQSICYRKCSKDTPGSSSGGFSASGNTFSFDFCIDNLEQDTEGASGDVEDSHDHNQGSIIAPGANSGFSFNFQISEDTASPLPSSGLQVATEKTNVVTETESRGKSEVETSNTESAGPASEPVKQEGTGKGSVDPPRKKKKKKGPKERTQGIVQKGSKPEAAAEITTNTSQDASQSGAEELRRELDWCVEQLEKGLQRQKSTAKQVEESLRAIKTLRSEKAPLVKKRQVMRAMFGDYRRKMEEEKQKHLRLLQIASQTARVTEVPDVQRRKNSKVFRQSSHSACKPTDTNPISPVLDSQAESPATTDGQAFLFRPSQEPFCFNFQL